MAIIKIIIHRSESNWGSAKVIDGWHKKNGWSGIGYHYVVGNSFPTSTSWTQRKPIFDNDGEIEVGRKFGTMGAHCKGHNSDSVGICLIGMRTFSTRQFHSVIHLVKKIRESYPDVEVFGHYELSDNKPNCPSINMDYLRELLKDA